MKTLNITTANNDKLLLAELPKGAINMRNIELESGKKTTILGTWNTITNEIDFTVDSAWVEDSKYYAKMWKNYSPIGKPSSRSNQCPRPIDSFISLLKSESLKAFPLKENHLGTDEDEYILSNIKRFMNGEGDPTDNSILLSDTWQQENKKVIPNRFLIIKIE